MCSYYSEFRRSNEIHNKFVLSPLYCKHIPFWLTLSFLSVCYSSTYVINWFPTLTNLLKQSSRWSFVKKWLHPHHYKFLWIEESHSFLTCNAGFKFLDGLFFSTPCNLFLYLWVSCLRGAVNSVYFGINFDKYPIIPRKLLIASFDSGRLHFVQL